MHHHFNLRWKHQPRLTTCSFGWWLVLVCSERKVLLAGCWWLVCYERKVLVADKPSEQSVKVLCPMASAATIIGVGFSLGSVFVLGENITRD
jgi:hypothetical protein